MIYTSKVQDAKAKGWNVKASKGADLDSNSSVTINDKDDIKVVTAEDQINTSGIAVNETVSIYTTGVHW